MIYFVERASDKLIKIGFTFSPQARLQTLQGQHGRVKLLGWVAGDSFTESTIHKAFKAERVTGEWFRPSPKLLNYIETRTCKIALEQMPDAVFSLWKQNRALKEELIHLRKMYEQTRASWLDMYNELLNPQSDLEIKEEIR